MNIIIIPDKKDFELGMNLQHLKFLIEEGWWKHLTIQEKLDTLDNIFCYL